MKLPGLLLLLLVHAAIVLGGVYLMLASFGEALDSELDAQVEEVQRDLRREFDRVREDVRRNAPPLPPSVPTP